MLVLSSYFSSTYFVLIYIFIKIVDWVFANFLTSIVVNSYYIDYFFFLCYFPVVSLCDLKKKFCSLLKYFLICFIPLSIFLFYDLVVWGLIFGFYYLLNIEIKTFCFVACLFVLWINCLIRLVRFCCSVCSQAFIESVFMLVSVFLLFDLTLKLSYNIPFCFTL